MEIRTAQRTEVERCATLIRKALPTISEVAGELATQGAIPTSTDNGCLLIAKDEDKLVGTAWCRNRLTRRGRSGLPIWCFEALAVRDSARSKGIGRALLTEVSLVATQCGVELVYGNCAPALVSYYEQFGWCGTERGRSLVLDTGSEPIALTGDDDQSFVSWVRMESVVGDRRLTDLGDQVVTKSGLTVIVGPDAATLAKLFNGQPD